MRVKKILSLIAFAFAFTLSTSLVGLTFDSGTAEKVSNFLQQDVQNGLNRDAEIYSLQADDLTSYSPEYVSVLKDYVNESGALDETGLPQDFQVAWLKHMRAWHNFNDFLTNSRNAKNGSEYRKLYKKHNREITVTWNEVLNVSQKHGATIPDGAY